MNSYNEKLISNHVRPTALLPMTSSHFDYIKSFKTFLRVHPISRKI